jgi:hypothetical protein
MSQISINGIRLGPGMVRVFQQTACDHNRVPVYQALAFHRINMACALLHCMDSELQFSGCLESRHKAAAARISKDLTDLPRMCLVSIYPHHGRLQVPAVLIRILAAGDLPFFHLVSSHAVLCVAIENRHQDSMISLLETAFDLPPSHTPYLQEIDQDISQFLKKYPETRATYEEEKIKTYGIQVTPGLDLYRLHGGHDQLTAFSRQMSDLDQPGRKFHFVSAMPGSQGDYTLFFLTDPGTGCIPLSKADLIGFHGPHFGDRYRILQTALDCLKADRVPLLLAGCTGASINLVVPAGKGAAARHALGRGFEAP